MIPVEKKIGEKGWEKKRLKKQQQQQLGIVILPKGGYTLPNDFFLCSEA